MNIETVITDENKVSMEKLIGNDLEIGLSNLKKFM